MITEYVEQRSDGYWISGSRVSLESVIFSFLDGLAPETIVTECFPVLSLEQVYGAITYYLSHRSEMNTYLRQVESEFDEFQHRLYDAAFSEKMTNARRGLLHM